MHPICHNKKGSELKEFSLNSNLKIVQWSKCNIYFFTQPFLDPPTTATHRMLNNFTILQLQLKKNND